MSRPGPLSERSLVLAPLGRDAQVAAMVLKDSGFPAEICADVPALCEELEKGAGLAIITDQAIHDADLRPLAACLKRQPPWSDFPVILLTMREVNPERSPALAKLGDLERDRDARGRRIPRSGHRTLGRQRLRGVSHGAKRSPATRRIFG